MPPPSAVTRISAASRRSSITETPGRPTTMWTCSRSRAADEHTGAEVGAVLRGALEATGKRTEAALAHLDEAVVIDIAGRYHQHAVGPVAFLDEADEVFASDAVDAVGGARHRPAERVARPVTLEEVVVDEIFGRILAVEYLPAG